MAVTIRLTRMGRKKLPLYRVVVADSRNSRDGKIIESIGNYEPKKVPAGVNLEMDRVDYWMKNGAQPSETVSKLIKQVRKGA